MSDSYDTPGKVRVYFLRPDEIARLRAERDTAAVEGAPCEMH